MSEIYNVDFCFWGALKGVQWSSQSIIKKVTSVFKKMSVAVHVDQDSLDFIWQGSRAYFMLCIILDSNKRFGFAQQL